LRNKSQKKHRGGAEARGRGGERASGPTYLLLCLVCSLTLTVGCSGNSGPERIRQAMYDQAKYDPLEASKFFANGMASRWPVAGTVARGHLKTDLHLHQGRVKGELAKTMPFELTTEVIGRGRERYDIFCSPCHGGLGAGDGMVVRRGMKAPPSFHVDRLREAPIGHTFDVITNGFGAMYNYASRVPAHDRWAIAAYVQALQLSQNAKMTDVPETERSDLQRRGSE
jgi:mono/diheme cytochrome c family protein